MAATLALLAGVAVAGPGQASAALCPGAGAKITPANAAAAETALLCLTNVYRVERGVPVLTHDSTLRVVARAHSQDMIDRDFFDHENPDGDKPDDRAQAAGYPGSVGENIAIWPSPPPNARGFFNLWRRSPGHNRNLLDLHGVRTRTAGMGFAVGGGVYLGTQMFGTVANGGTETALHCPGARQNKRAKRRAFDRARAQAKKRKRAVNRAGSAKAKKRAKRRLKSARKKAKRARREVKMAGRVVSAACD